MPFGLASPVPAKPVPPDEKLELDELHGPALVPFIATVVPVGICVDQVPDALAALYAVTVAVVAVAAPLIINCTLPFEIAVIFPVAGSTNAASSRRLMGADA